MDALVGWESFYVIVGSSAGALIGLQFVVMTLLAARPPASGAVTGAAFATPQIVHFSVTLFLSALMQVPWHSVAPFRAICLLAGAGGITYVATVAVRMRQQRDYRPVLEDWVFHLLLPAGAYLVLLVTAAFIGEHTGAALLTIAGAALMLLLTGIHNTWDALSYHVLVQGRHDDKSR